MTLESNLELLVNDVRFPETPDFASSIGYILAPVPAPIRRPRRTLLVAGLVAILLAATIAVPESRHAFANWFGFGGIRIELVDRLLDRDDRVAIDSSLIVGEQVEPGSTRFMGLPDTAVDRVYRRVEGEATTLSSIYAPSDHLPEIGDTGVGALLMQTDASIEFVFAVKQTLLSSPAQFVQIGGMEGYWVESGQLVAVPYDPKGTFGLESVSRSTGNVLLWQVDGITYRLETNLSRAEAIELAKSLVPIES